MPFVRRPVRLTGGEHPDRPPRALQKKSKKGLGLLESHLPTSAKQRAWQEQERAARKRAKEIRKARKGASSDGNGKKEGQARKVDPGSATVPAPKVKTKKIYSSDQRKPKKKSRGKPGNPRGFRNGGSPRAPRRATSRIPCAGCDGDIAVLRAGPQPRFCRSCQSRSILCCRSCWAPKVYDLCALCGKRNFREFDLPILTRQQFITLAQGLGGALEVAQQEVSSGISRKTAAKIYGRHVKGSADSDVNLDVSTETLMALVITLDQKVREALRKLNAVEARRDHRGSS
jgi:hypothetical protein